MSANRGYDAFGILVATAGSPVGPFGFAGASGYQEDGDSGLKLLGHRYYDPSTGRFLTRDPAKDGRNWYDYCDENPLAAIDPDGLYIKWDVGKDKKSQRLALEILYWLMAIANDSETGSALANDVLFGDREYTIQVRAGSHHGSSWDAEHDTFRFDSGEKGVVWGASDGLYYEFTWMRIVSHELGHVIQGDEDKNVDDFENPVSAELGDSRHRIDYWHETKKKGDVPKDKIGGGPPWRQP